MTSLAAYMTGLFLVCGGAVLTGLLHRESREQIWRASTAIFLNWCAGMLFIHNTGNQDPWEFNLFIDSAAAFAVLWHPAGRAQAYIGLFYFFQIAGHVAYGAREWWGLPNDAIYYYDSITFVAWAQLAALGVWSGGIWGKALLHNLRDWRHAPDRGKAVSNGKGAS